MAMSDLAEVTALVRRCEQHFTGESFVDEADVTGLWATPGVDLDRDSLAAFATDGRLVGGALVDDRHHLVVDVDPAHLGRGIGTTLADWVEDRARERGLAHGEQEVPVADRAGAELLSGRGYATAHRDWVLRMDPDADLRHHALAADVTIDAFDDADAPAVHAVIEDAFAEWPGRVRRSYDDWRVVNIDREGARPGDFLVAKAGGEVIGAAIVHDSDGTTWIPQLAVRADRRGEGVAQELLAQAFEAGRRRGCATGELSTSELTGALGLYQRLGMRIVAEFQTWRLNF